MKNEIKYVVSHNGAPLFEGKRLSKAMTACAIFNAYLKENPLTTLEELRKAFPCEKHNDYYYNRKFNELFYEFNCDGYILFTAGKHEGEKTLAQWDFYVDDEKLLPIENGQKKAMCVKMWRKGDFDKLIEWVNEKYDFITIDEC